MLGRVLINRGSIEDVCFTTNSRRAAGPLKESAKCQERTSAKPSSPESSASPLAGYHRSSGLRSVHTVFVLAWSGRSPPRFSMSSVLT